MSRIPVTSKIIKSIGYDPLVHTLEVEFSSGSVWQYIEVPATIYTQLMGSLSVGSYFSKIIKGKYQEKKIS